MHVEQFYVDRIRIDQLSGDHIYVDHIRIDQLSGD